MKKQYIIISAIIVVFGIAIASMFILKQNRDTESAVEEISIPLETSIPESTVTPEPIPEPTVEPTVEPTESPESTPKPITKNEDGTYTFSEEFLESLSQYPYFEGASEELVMYYLNTMAKDLIIMKERDIKEAFNMLGKNGRLVDNWRLPEDTGKSQATSASASTPAPENNSSTSTNNTTAAQPPQDSQEQSGSSADWNLGDAFSDANTTPIGGDGTNIDHTGATVTVPGDASNSDEEGYINNGDGTITSSDGTFTMGDGSSFGGGERIDSGAVIY